MLGSALSGVFQVFFNLSELRKESSFITWSLEATITQELFCEFACEESYSTAIKNIQNVWFWTHHCHCAPKRLRKWPMNNKELGVK